MSQTKTAPLPSRIAFLLGGLASLVLVGSLLWAGFIIPLNTRRPVPSPDGKYFAYFNPEIGRASCRERVLSVV